MCRMARVLMSFHEWVRNKPACVGEGHVGVEVSAAVGNFISKKYLSRALNQNDCNTIFTPWMVQVCLWGWGAGVSAAAAVYAIVPEPWFGLAHPAMFALSWQPRPLTRPRPRSGPGPNLGLGNVGTALVLPGIATCIFTLRFCTAQFINSSSIMPVKKMGRLQIDLINIYGSVTIQHRRKPRNASTLARECTKKQKA